MTRNYIAGLIGLLLFAACTHKDILLENALTQAGTNRVELEKVLDRYRDTDEEKYRAACFLIRNMPFYSFYEGKDLEKYHRYYKAPYANGWIIRSVVDSVKQADGEFSMLSLTKRKDIEVVDSAFLVTHIDWAFKVRREQPWGKNVSFEDFCEYILPYRIGDEPLSLWRKKLYETYNPVLDSLRATPFATDPLQAAQVVLAHLTETHFQYTGLFPVGPHIGPDILQWRIGSCRDLADGLMYVCRALGVPCGADKVIIRGDCHASHLWNFTLDKDRNSYVTEFPYASQWKPSKEFIGKQFGKIYRTTYSLNVPLMEKGKEAGGAHPNFQTPFFHDVTAAYVSSPKQAIEIPVSQLRQRPEQGEAVYLCLSDKLGWMPVDYITYEGGDIRFKHVQNNITCMLATWKDGEVTPLCDPFHIEKDTDELHFYTPETATQPVCLTIKFLMAAYDYYHSRMVGGVIEGSNRKDFKEADTLYTITQAPYRLYSVAALQSDRPYRYIRYRGGKDSYCNIAELAFYADRNDTIPLPGKLIGTPGCHGNDGTHEYTNVFDGDDKTSFNYMEADTGWAGLDFGKPIRVRKAVYTPRNQVNFIYKGYDYELFYWGDGRWNSLGRQTATADSLLYQAPVNALLYLQCHTEGKDEHVFEYKDGKQIFR